ncbi:hypothetical protein YC2023_039395 [Brassica napus]
MVDSYESFLDKIQVLVDESLVLQESVPLFAVRQFELCQIFYWNPTKYLLYYINREQ